MKQAVFEFGRGIKGNEQANNRYGQTQRLREMLSASVVGRDAPRLPFARALAVGPEMLLIEEPFSALDAQTREIMQTVLMRI